MYELQICHLYPDLLNLYGDHGNLITLERRCAWRGIGVTITPVTVGDDFEGEKYDIVFIGGGQDYEQSILQPDIVGKKGAAITRYVQNGGVLLAICGGYQLLGKYYQLANGEQLSFLGALDLWTVAGEKRMIGNIALTCDFVASPGEEGWIVGFENHSGRTYLGTGVKPLGRVRRGFGNNGEDGLEGAVYKNTVASYCHGSLLPKNPALADYLLTAALHRKYPDFTELSPLDDSIENGARKAFLQRMKLE